MPVVACGPLSSQNAASESPQMAAYATAFVPAGAAHVPVPARKDV